MACAGVAPPSTKTHLLDKASITSDYLHSNSTTHEFCFGAIAELVDNSKDASSNTLDVDVVKTEIGEAMTFLDDGCGMSRSEAKNVLCFGHSSKRSDSAMIGQYGNGLKSGSMRLAHDFILFTKRDGVETCVLLSRTFHEDRHLSDVFVPAPSFICQTGEAMYESHEDKDSGRHEYEMSIIRDYSPYKTDAAVMQQFEKIKGSSGTLVVLYNLRRIDTGALELDFVTDECDVRLSHSEEYREEERNSLRAYLQVLYIVPRMRINLRGKKVFVKWMIYSLAERRHYTCTTSRLESAPKREKEACARKEREIEDAIRTAQSQLGQFQNKHSAQARATDELLRRRGRQLQAQVADAKEQLERARRRSSQAGRAGKYTNIDLHYGLNLHHRNRYGCMIYNNGRLITMYVKTAAQSEKNDRMMKCLGVVGIVDVPYSVLEPTHNKQAFADARDYHALLKEMNQYMLQYWDDIALGAKPNGGVEGFWRSYGYLQSSWTSEGTETKEMQTKRKLAIGSLVQCDLCGKWREVLVSQLPSANHKEGTAWNCQKHTNAKFNSCEKKEVLPEIKKSSMSDVTKKLLSPLGQKRSAAQTSAKAAQLARERARAEQLAEKDRKEQQQREDRAFQRKLAEENRLAAERQRRLEKRRTGRLDKADGSRAGGGEESSEGEGEEVVEKKTRLSLGAPPRQQLATPARRQKKERVEESERSGDSEENEQSEEEEEKPPRRVLATMCARKSATRAEMMEWERKRDKEERKKEQRRAAAKPTRVSTRIAKQAPFRDDDDDEEEEEEDEEQEQEVAEQEQVVSSSTRASRSAVSSVAVAETSSRPAHSPLKIVVPRQPTTTHHTHKPAHKAQAVAQSTQHNETATSDEMGELRRQLAAAEERAAAAELKCVRADVRASEAHNTLQLFKECVLAHCKSHPGDVGRMATHASSTDGVLETLKMASAQMDKVNEAVVTMIKWAKQDDQDDLSHINASNYEEEMDRLLHDIRSTTEEDGQYEGGGEMEE